MVRMRARKANRGCEKDLLPENLVAVNELPGGETAHLSFPASAGQKLRGAGRLLLCSPCAPRNPANYSGKNVTALAGRSAAATSCAESPPPPRGDSVELITVVISTTARQTGTLAE